MDVSLDLLMNEAGYRRSAPNPLLCVLKYFPEDLKKPLGSWS